jgi:uncharacterized NAD(P)/FAD-binding protein YdhS
MSSHKVTRGAVRRIQRDSGEMPHTRPTVLTIIGAGPRGVGVLERIAANLAVEAPALPLDIHLIDPFPPGGGRIWRSSQSGLLKLNSMAEDVTMFTDSSSTIDGPILAGPTLVDWAEGIRNQTIVDVDPPADLRAQIDELTGSSFPTRQLQSLYLDWFYRRAHAALPDTVRLFVHPARALDVTGEGDSLHSVQLDDGTSLTTDLVLYALGHIESGALPAEIELAEFARANALTYLPPSYTADADTSDLTAGTDVIVRGMGLASVDLVVLLTEGRGGRFARDSSGTLRYTASGLEPRIHLGSRRGVPYHSKIGSTLAAPRATPRYFSAAVAQRLAAESPRLALRDDVWPLIAKEVLHGYYHELFVGHPDRVEGNFSDFIAQLDEVDWNSDELRLLIESVVPDVNDRLDLVQLDRPLAGVALADAESLQDHVRDYIRTDLHLRSAPEHSATLALFYSLLFSHFDLGGIVDSPKWTARSRVEDFGDWWMNLFSFIASGPPAHRLEELLALSEAGVVHFLGANLTVTADPSGHFVARSGSVPGVTVADALVDARLPSSDVTRTLNPVVSALLQSGLGAVEQVADADFAGSTGRLRVDPADSRILDTTGTPQTRRFAIGPYTSAPFVGAFSRPNTNAVSFRENDRVARALLHAARSIAEADAVLIRERTR